MPLWRLANPKSITLDRPRFIAILNLTPDSFHDGGRINSAAEALAAATRFVAEGADMLDIGGESTRPGAASISPVEQLRRVLPAILAIRRELNIPVSIDTTSAEVARAALDAGADAINDISAGTDDLDMLPLAAAHRCGLIMMHRLRRPRDDSYSDQYSEPPRYTDVVGDVKSYLRDRADAALAAGVAGDSIILDPGLGFGKTVDQNLELLRRTPELADLGFPILSALSRKSFTARAAGIEVSTPADRLPPTIALSLAHYAAGARIFRVHDVAPHVAAFRAAAATLPQ